LGVDSVGDAVPLELEEGQVGPHARAREEASPMATAAILVLRLDDHLRGVITR
jgi:hypothetical protein